jgi:hypothetical protein
VLQGRTFGLPNVALVAAAAAVIWLFFLRGRPTSSTSAVTAPGANSTYGLGFAQGLQAGAVQPAPPAAPAQAAARPGTATLVSAPRFGELASQPGPPVYDANGRVTGQFLPWGTTVNVAGSPVGNGALYPVTGPGGDTVYVARLDVASFTAPGQGGGIGGPVRKHAIGSRSAHQWQDAHPGVGARVPYAHYVRAVGGPRNHIREVHRVAQQSGVHPARILMLNPEPTGRIRVA